MGKLLTVVDDMGPHGPKRWQDAAKIVVCEIFDSVETVLGHLVTNQYLDEVQNPDFLESLKKEENLNSVLEGLHLLDIQFEGMLNNSKWFSSDSMYWVEEWKILGSIAAAAGIQNGNLKPEEIGINPEFATQSASAGVFDTWMVREHVTRTLVKKQSDYGHENISRFGRGGLLVRCHDKMARLKNLHLVRNAKASNESVTDTYLDIIGYSAIGMLWEREWFLLPLTPDSNEESI